MLEKYFSVTVRNLSHDVPIILILLAIVIKPVILDTDCSHALGMEDKRITDSQIITSSQHRTSCVGHNARLNNKDTSCAAWCPNITNAVPGSVLSYTEYIQIDFRKPTMVTKVATQAMYNHPIYRVKKYKISYSFDEINKWKYIRHNGSVKIFPGNTNKPEVVDNTFLTPIVARYIRIHPGIYKVTYPQCLRLELYGCPWTDTGQVRSYSMPKGGRAPNQKLIYTDTDYNGKLENNVYTGGVGLLTDCKPGPVDSKRNDGTGWIGWLYTGIHPHGVNITFEFYSVRKFTNVTLTMNVNKARQNSVFKKSRIFFANREDSFNDDDFLEYCPKQDGNETKNVDVSLSLCGSTGKFVRIQLFPRSKWTLISEVKFISEPAKDAEAETMNCKNNFMCEAIPVFSLPPTSTTTFRTDITKSPGGSINVVGVAAGLGGWLFGMVILYAIHLAYRRLRDRRKENTLNDVRSLHEYEIPGPQDSTYEQVGLDTIGGGMTGENEEDEMSSTYEEAVDQTGYAQLNQARRNEDVHNYQSLNPV